MTNQEIGLRCLELAVELQASPKPNDDWSCLQKAQEWHEWLMSLENQKDPLTFSVPAQVAPVHDQRKTLWPEE